MLTAIRRVPISIRICSSISLCLHSGSDAHFARQCPSLSSNRGPVGGEGSNTIEGRVYFPSGDHSGKAIKLHLESNLAISTKTQSPIRTAFSDLTVFLRNIHGGGRGGKEYENSRETITIEPIGSSRVSQVNIQLRPKMMLPTRPLPAFQNRRWMLIKRARRRRRRETRKRQSNS